MTQELHEYFKDDIINSEIEQEHKETSTDDYQSDVAALIAEIKTSQDAKKRYFTEVLAGKHPGKKLMQQRIAIQFVEVVDYDKNKLVYEETEADEKANRKYLNSCSVKIDKAALLFANELQKHETFSIEQFDLYAREYPTQEEPQVKVKCFDMSTENIKELSEIPPESLKAVKDVLEKVVVTGDKGKEKDTEAETATV